MRVKKSKLIIASGFGALIAIMIAVSLVGFLHFAALHERITKLSDDHYNKTDLIYNMHLAVRERTISLILMTNIKDPFTRDEEMLRFNKLGAEFADERAALKRFSLTPEEQALLNQQSQYTIEARPLQEKLIDFALAGNAAAANRFLTDTALPKQSMVVDTLKDLHAVEDAKYYEQLGEMTNEYRVAYIVFMAALCATTIGFGAFITFLVTRKIDSIESELFKEKERYALAVRGANDGVWDWDLISNEIYFSPRWKDMLGYEEHALDNKVEEWMKRVHADDLEKLQSALNGHLNGLSFYFENEHRLMHRDGKYRWFLTRGLALRDEHGKAYRIAGSQSDITDRKRYEKHMSQNESRMRMVLDHVIDGIVTTSDRGIVESMNHAAEAMFEHKSDEVVGRPFTRLLSDPFKSEFEKHFLDYANTGTSALLGNNHELRGLRKHGTTFPLTFTVAEMQLGSDRKLIFIARDVSQRQSKRSA